MILRRHLRFSHLARCLAALVTLPLPPAFGGIGDNPDLEVVFQFTLAPSGVTTATDGSWIMGVNQSEKPQMRAVRISHSGEVSPFPNEKMSRGDVTSPIPLDAVEALQSDAAGVVWLLDNGRRSELPPKVIAWNPVKLGVQQVCYLSPPAVVPGSFVADVCVDAFSPLVFISDPANGTDAALIILDRSTGISRRFLQGHAALQPDISVPLKATRTGQETRRLDGSFTVPHCGIRPLIMDRKGQWLYFAAVQSKAVYRLPGALLRMPDLTQDRRKELVKVAHQYAEKARVAARNVRRSGAVASDAIASDASAVTFVTASGVRGARLDESSYAYAVVSRKADGTLAMGCVDGADQATKAVHDGVVAEDHAKESHDETK